MKRLLTLVALFAAAGGCAPMEWVKADATPEQAAEDSKQCQDVAWREANLRWARYYGAYGPMQYQDSIGRRFLVWPWGPFSDPYGDRYLEESRLTNYCMRAKGYELRNAPKS